MNEPLDIVRADRSATATHPGHTRHASGHPTWHPRQVATKRVATFAHRRHPRHCGRHATLTRLALSATRARHSRHSRHARHFHARGGRAIRLLDHLFLLGHATDERTGFITFERILFVFRRLVHRHQEPVHLHLFRREQLRVLAKTSRREPRRVEDRHRVIAGRNRPTALIHKLRVIRDLVAIFRLEDLDRVIDLIDVLQGFVRLPHHVGRIALAVAFPLVTAVHKERHQQRDHAEHQLLHVKKHEPLPTAFAKVELDFLHGWLPLAGKIKSLRGIEGRED